MAVCELNISTGHLSHKPLLTCASIWSWEVCATKQGISLSTRMHQVVVWDHLELYNWGLTEIHSEPQPQLAGGLQGEEEALLCHPGNRWAGKLCRRAGCLMAAWGSCYKQGFNKSLFSETSFINPVPSPLVAYSVFKIIRLLMQLTWKSF